jgi:lysine 2,3-aminomutase
MSAENKEKYTAEVFRARLPAIVELAKCAVHLDELRQGLSQLTHRMASEAFEDYGSFAEGSIIRVRDCARILFRMFTRRSEQMAAFSVTQAIRDIALERQRDDLQPAFFADLMHLLLGLQGRGPGSALADILLEPSRSRGRQAAIERSQQLDRLEQEVNRLTSRYKVGLTEAALARRQERREKIMAVCRAKLSDWQDWQWQVDHIFRNAEEIAEVLNLSEQEFSSIESAKQNRLPFGITPYYLSLMDDDPEAGRDRSIRAQVLPPRSYVNEVAAQGENASAICDFMREIDTSPIKLITRRYPTICIFKPFNTCPQICVYCQRNWEIQDAMEPGALAPETEIDAALDWIRVHPAIHEVLLTGGDPLAMSDDNLEAILDGLASIPTVERLRIGSRTLVTMPMRITERLADLLAKHLKPGRRQVALVTHVQHPYEITPEMVTAVQRLRERGISSYNQLVYTFFISRRYEAAFLRRQLALIGIEPYYTFSTKGKEETIEYRVPLARLLQEQKEEARLLPGLSRTDEAVYNVPGLGKNYLRARQHRDLLAILSNGTRLYEFHPWEKNISGGISTYVCEDVPILDYLQRLEAIGEDISDYQTIWYYF